MDQVEIYQSAWLMLKHYGEDAIAEAESRAEQMRVDGDPVGVNMWLRTRDAIEEMLKESAKVGKRN